MLPDDLDGCDLDFSGQAIADADILSVVFGDDPVKFEEYRRLLAAPDVDS